MLPQQLLIDRITPGTVIDGRFEIERLANAGGMGEVFRAKDQRTNLPVAVKVVRNSDAVHLSRFDRETRTLAQLEHPNIVRYIAHGREPAVFLAMEWLDGEDLSHRLARGPLSIADTLLLAKTITEALAAAHALGIVHRDIKPSNIFLCEGRIGAAKVVDFGIAQVTKSTRAITGTGQILGTLGYMAPEQALSGRDVTAAVDVYSLGCVLYECLTGSSPFAGEWPQILTRILMSDPPRIREARPDAPLALEELIMRMLRREPERRASLDTVAADVAAFLTAGEMLAGDALAGANVPAVTGDERRLVAVIVIDTAHAPDLMGSADTVPSSTNNLQAVVAKYGGELTILPTGTSLVVLSAGAGGTDLAARAARCALALRECMGKTRIALASGRGDPTRPSVVATVVDRASLLFGGDGASTHVRIDPVMAGLLDATFVVTGDGTSLALVAERDQTGARKLLGEATPCIGRERELATLHALVAECLDEPLSTALVITGNPGIGKSRLRHEVVQALRVREDAPEIWTARGDPVAAGSPYGMLAQLLHRIAGLDKAEVAEVRRQKLLARVGRHLPIHDAIRVAEILGDVVGAEFSAEDRPNLRAARQDPAAMSDQLRRAWEDLVAAEVATAPLALVLEDLQWGDLPTIRLVDGVLRNNKHRPLLVLSIARPELADVFPGLFRDRRVHEVRLGELTPSASRKLVLDVLGSDTSPAVVDAIVETSHGNPFYLEELVRSVAEGETKLPETVLATAQARLQRLDPGARRLLRAASVFGTKFWLNGVAALLGADAASEIQPTLDTLVQREVVMRQPSSRFHGDDEYAFRQTLVRDAAYDMLTARDRRQAHARAADWLESNGERDALVIAEHLERSDDRSRAVIWYLWAAEQAMEGNDLEAVFSRAERGASCGATGVMLGELTLLKAEASGWAGLANHQSLAAAALELLPVGSSAWTRAAGELAIACRTAGDLERLRSTAQRVADAPIDAASLLVQAWARARIVVSLLGVEEPALAERLVASITSVLPKADEIDAPNIRTLTDWLGLAIAQHEEHGDPRPFLEKATSIADAFEAEGYGRWSAMVSLQATIATAKVPGATKDGIAWAERAGAHARRLGLKSIEIRSRAWLAVHLADSGHVDAALTTAESAVRDAPGDRVAEADAQHALHHVVERARSRS